jgi:hypothetical protein
MSRTALDTPIPNRIVFSAMARSVIGVALDRGDVFFGRGSAGALAGSGRGIPPAASREWELRVKKKGTRRAVRGVRRDASGKQVPSAGPYLYFIRRGVC